MPITVRSDPRCTKSRILPTTQAKMIRCLLSGSVSSQEIQDFSGVGPTTLRHYLRALRDEKLVFITGWRHDCRGRAVIALYSLAPELTEDTPRPGRTPRRLYRVRAPQNVAHDVFAGLANRL